MSDVKIEVLKKFRDARTGEIHLPNDTLEVSNDRLAEIMAVNVHLVRVVDQQEHQGEEAGAPEDQKPDAVGEDAETEEPEPEAVGEDAETEEPEPEAEEKPKPKRGRKPANNNQ